MFDNLLLVFLNLQVQVTYLSFHVYQGSMHNKHFYGLFKTKHSKALKKVNAHSQLIIEPDIITISLEIKSYMYWYAFSSCNHQT